MPENSEVTPVVAPVDDVDALKADVAKWKALSRQNEDKAKANAKVSKEFETWKASQLSESEKAIEDAKSSTRAEVAKEYGEKFARTAFLAAAKGRLEKPEEILKRVDVAQFLDDKGEPDEAAITEFLDSITPAVAPEVQPTFTGLFQGQRGDQAGSALPLNGDPLLAKVMGILGAK